MKYIDNFLNSITMYRLVLYSTVLLTVLGIAASFLGLLPYSGVGMLISLVILVATCMFVNYFCGWIFSVPVNAESSYITAFILFLILPQATSLILGLLVFLAALIAMTSKFVFAINRKHIFNPAALGAFAISLTGLGASTWWIGNKFLLPFVVVIGLLFVRKVRKFGMFASFAVVAFIGLIVKAYTNGFDLGDTILEGFISTPLIFFGAVMLTEPLTMPPKRSLQMVYGGLVGLLYSLPFNFGIVFNSPELSLLLGNIFSYFVSPKKKLLLTLKEKIQMAPLVYDFVFTPDSNLKFEAGQYLEWTLPIFKTDGRGNRRYFTIASSPTENEIHLGVKIPPTPSLYKKVLLAMKPGDTMLAGQLAGDFTLPNTNRPIVCIAGGIGITPFRSMIKKIIDSGTKRDLTLLYASSDVTEFVYRDVFDAAENFGVKTAYILSGAKEVPSSWQGPVGYITADMVKQNVSNYDKALYYISGPNVMVENYKKMLKGLGISRLSIITDYFPGY